MSADRAAFRALDLEGTSFEAWRKVNVETKAESWSGPSEKLLAKCSDVVIQLNSGETPTPSVIDDKLGDLLAA